MPCDFDKTHCDACGYCETVVQNENGNIDLKEINQKETRS